MKVSEIVKQVKERGIGAISFLFEFTKHSVSVKIYKTPREGYDAFTLIYYKGWTPFAWKHNALRHSFI